MSNKDRWCPTCPATEGGPHKMSCATAWRERPFKITLLSQGRNTSVATVKRLCLEDAQQYAQMLCDKAADMFGPTVVVSVEEES